MKKTKMYTMLIVAFLGLAILGAGSLRAAPAYGLRGIAIASYDESVRWLDDLGNHYGTITAVNLDNPATTAWGADYAQNNDGSGSYFMDEAQSFGWAGDSLHPKGWSEPVGAGDTILFLAEYEGYVFAGQVPAVDPNTPPDGFDFLLRYEPIPTPVEEAQGDDWIEITIPHFKYTDADDMAGTTLNRGTYDVFMTYAVYLRADGGAWEYLGNSELHDAGTDSPIPGYGDATDPTTIDTGSQIYRAEGLLQDVDYEFAVRPVFGDGPNVWGHSIVEGEDMSGETVEGAVTTFTVGSASEVITIPPDMPEFGVGLLVPVVAIIGMFVAFTVYRRKRDE